MTDLRFPTALQMMLGLVLAEREGVATMSSTQLAEGLGANPSLVRKLLVPLVRAGLVQSFMGKSGGVRLGRPAGEITLRDIYCCVTDGKKLWSARSNVPHRCLVSSNIERFFDELADEAEQAMLDTLGRRTLEQSFAELRVMDKARPAKRAPHG
ncbi:MAG TPA: Rrf2 family transcriptional regulator [Cystobacter sp.]